MPAQDSFKPIVEIALNKSGWQDVQPLVVRYRTDRLEVDLEAEQVIRAEQRQVQIAVEVKSFATTSAVYELHQAVGQYLHYRLALDYNAMPHKLYLAVPASIYRQHFNRPIFQASIQAHQIQIMVVDEFRQEVVQWLPDPLR